MFQGTLSVYEISFMMKLNWTQAPQIINLALKDTGFFYSREIETRGEGN